MSDGATDIVTKKLFKMQLKKQKNPHNPHATHANKKTHTHITPTGTHTQPSFTFKKNRSTTPKKQGQKSINDGTPKNADDFTPEPAATQQSEGVRVKLPLQVRGGR